MDAVLIAGGKSEPSDPLYPYTGDGYKSLLMLGGKPMVQWVLDALNGSKRVERVVVVGLPQDTRLNCTHELSMLEGCGDLIHNIRAGAEYLIQHNPDQKHCLLISADIPALTTGMVDWLIDRVQESDHDLYYNVIERRDMETRFPQSRRTYVRLKDGEFCGGDAGAICKQIAARQNPLVDRLIEARKNPLRQAGLMGLDTLLLLLLRQLTIRQAVKKVGIRLGLKGRALVCPYPEMGMDVDKPYQFEIMQNEIDGRAAA